MKTFKIKWIEKSNKDWVKCMERESIVTAETEDAAKFLLHKTHKDVTIDKKEGKYIIKNKTMKITSVEEVVKENKEEE